MKVLLCILSVVGFLGGYEIKGCLQNERSGLIEIKSYFTSINLDKTGIYGFPAWHVADNKSDCCYWEGVGCSPYTGRVVRLLLSGKVFTNEPWNLNMTVFRPFEELETLDLSWNYIGSLVRGEGLCRFKNLEDLDFRGNRLSADLPRCLWNSTSLRGLDISGNAFIGSLPSYINIPSIEWLLVNDNRFQGKFLFSSLSNHSRLQGLTLSNNLLQVEIEESPPSNFQPRVLGLGSCNLSTQANNLWKFLYYQSNLQYIDLYNNTLLGSFPNWLLHNNSDLEHLSLSNNSLTGNLLQLTEHTNLSLALLDISGNRFSGKIPHHTGMILSSLQILAFSDNSFQGHIPPSIGNMTQLTVLDLSGNKLSGEIPWELFSYCTNLEFLDLSSNNLQGEIIPKIMNLPQLVFLSLRNNHFVGTMKESLANSTSVLNFLDISYNMAKGELPSWIGSFQTLELLTLENNQFQGKIPFEICQLGLLVYMDLSSNRFVGEIPPCVINVDSIRYLLMHGNNLTGAIPVELFSMAQLVMIDLANNHISGVLSPWIGLLSKLGTLILRGNRLQGEVPNELCLLKGLNILDLSNNNFSGVIPSCLSGLSFGNTKLSDIYSSFGVIFKDGEKLADAPFDFLELVTVMASDVADFVVKNRYSSYVGNILSIMSALDLSNNKLVGDIPSELGDLTKMNALNFSHNCLNGSIPESFSKLKSIESLDLSSNKLSGKIPSQLADLNFLAIFNVSYNNLSGEVPETGQFGGFDENNYRGNHDLCGSRLPKKCTLISKPPSSPPIDDGDEGEARFDLEVFLWSFAASFVTMLVSTFLVLYINAGWRQAWFTFADFHLLWWIY